MLKQIINQDEEAEAGASDAPSPQFSGGSEGISKPKSTPSMTSSKNILSSDVEIRGKLRFAKDLIVDGCLQSSRSWSTYSVRARFSEAGMPGGT